jgi:hypothetical protein
MKKIPFILIPVLALFFVSCSKEYSEENGSPVSPVNPLLVRYVLNDDLSRIESNFDYNGERKLIGHSLSAVAGGFAVNLAVFANRDANSRISSATLVVRSSFNPTGDTIRYQFSRNTAGRINYYLLIPFDNAIAGYDSVVCTYNAQNKLITQLVYLKPTNSSVGIPIQRIEMAYAGNNMITYRDFALSGGTTGGVLEEAITFEYDNRPAALPLSEDEYIIGLGLENPGENNVTKLSRVYPADPDDNVTKEYRYTFGTNGRPATAEVITVMPGLPNGRGTATYTYQ